MATINPCFMLQFYTSKEIEDMETRRRTEDCTTASLPSKFATRLKSKVDVRPSCFTMDNYLNVVKNDFISISSKIKLI